MNKKLPIILIGAVLVLIAGIFVFTLLNSSSDTPTISLPGSVTEAWGNDGSLITITPENVQTALSTIGRVDEYSREYYVTTFWSGGNSTASVKVWQNGDLLRISQKQHGISKNIVFSGDNVYYWYGDSNKVYSAKHSDFDSNDLDRYSRIISYQEILSIPTERILEAGYEEKLGENCIYAVYESEDKHYVNRIYVSVNTGLLVAAESEENGIVINSMSSVITTLATPDDDIFIPPTT